uniref:Uncharacterized protein n=1 Tax=Glossina palpalis gambiensis TaxID=67801 RepID=A0A1B0BT85_9MUSC
MNINKDEQPNYYHYHKGHKTISVYNLQLLAMGTSSLLMLMLMPFSMQTFNYFDYTSSTSYHLVALGTLSKCTDPESHAGGTVFAGRATQVKNSPDERQMKQCNWSTAEAYRKRAPFSQANVRSLTYMCLQKPHANNKEPKSFKPRYKFKALR